MGTENFALPVSVPPRDKSRKKNTPTILLLPELANCIYNAEVALNRIKEILDKLSINHKLLEKRGNNVSLDIIAYTNTWSNQRRKRRLMKKIITEAKIPKIETGQDETINNSVKSSETIVNTLELPKLQSYEDLSNCKQVELNKSEDERLDDSTNSIQDQEDQPLVHAFLKLLKKNNNFLIEMEFLDGCGGKEGLHQIMQYIKNNWK